MSSYNQDQDDRSGVPKYSGNCGKNGCKNKTNLALMKVSSGDGIQLKPASDVSTTTTFKEVSVTTMNQNYNFIHWWTICDEHLATRIRDNKAKLRMAGEDPNYC